MELAWMELQGREAHEAGRALLEALYRRTTGGPMPTIAVTARGKPCFPGSGWHFSISHTKRQVFCALSRKNIGIDAEEMDRRIDPRLSARWLSPMEQAQVAAAEDPDAALLQFWVLKEAWAKLTGQGIGNYLKETGFLLKDSRILERSGCYIAILEDEEPCFLTPTPI